MKNKNFAAGKFTSAICVFLLFVIPLTGFAQTENNTTSELKNEIGINLFSVQDFQYYNHDPGPGETFRIGLYPAEGMYYKRHFGKNVWRVSAGYHQEIDFETLDYGNYYYHKEGIYRTGVVRAGYEREFGSKRWTPFVSGDLFFQLTKLQGKESYWGDFGSCENCPLSETTIESGLAAGAGVKYQLSSHIVLTAEMAGQLFYEHPTKSYNGYVDWRWNPLQTLGVAWKF